MVNAWLVGQEPGKRRMRRLRTKKSEKEGPAGGKDAQ